MLYSFVNEDTTPQPISSYIQENMATLSQRLQWVLLCIHQYKINILYKPGLQLHIADWLSRFNHNENKDEGIWYEHQYNYKCTYIPEYMMLEEIRYAAQADDYLDNQWHIW